ncbi:ParB/RepB/Spo0J family partition protein [Limosilactobacillus equigenerosi]|uniref:Chromosome partitioning protein ParB n=1 Tax=Limosilactobacillus equigenerosi DSM 18793 = JCM 14505 TaxID=1423742 RepID=A0A0R1V0D4_9LACO|nr:ParB/RepB/Spo0J family partition protein [Limosilactobacillus equigenerosi]KRL96482.1 Chromosome partitioning protein ParB [Limosilactobacillus equigenerosi DSM 18793 = JCM 14505]
MTNSQPELVVEIPLDQVRPNPYQPRRIFDQAALSDLTASIQQNGVFQPIIVRQPDLALDRYEIIAGERRFRASQAAGKTTIPAVVRQLDDRKMMEIAVVENLQRENLTPLEEAQSYHNLMEKLSLTQQEVAALVGKSRSYIANSLRLLSLPDSVKVMVNRQQLSMGQARTLLGLKNSREIIALATRAVEESLTVRQLEQIVNPNQRTKGDRQRLKSRPKETPFVREITNQLATQLGSGVKLTGADPLTKGAIMLPYHSPQELNRLLTQLGVTFED